MGNFDRFEEMVMEITSDFVDLIHQMDSEVDFKV